MADAGSAPEAEEQVLFSGALLQSRSRERHITTACNMYLAEFVGTYTVTMTLGCVVVTNPSAWDVTAVAMALLALTYALARISGAHFNPAVSFACGLAGKLSWPFVIMYIVMQLAGAICAGLTYSNLFAPFDYAQGHAGLRVGSRAAHWVEFFYTTFFCFVVLNMLSNAKLSQGKSEFYGLAIASVVLAGGYAAGPISGGCMNPAIAIGVDLSSWSSGVSWSLSYAAVQLLGSALAALLFLLCRPEELRATGVAFEIPAVAVKLFAEFCGTLLLCVTVGLNVLAGSRAPVWSIAFCLTALVFSLGSCSGAHLNPAVSLAALVANAISARDAFMYMATQLLAGICAAFVFGGLIFDGQSFPLTPGSGYTLPQACWAEFMFTFVLAFVVLAVAVAANGKDHNQVFGLAIGGCVMAGGCAIGAVSGGALNPAVALSVFTAARRYGTSQSPAATLLAYILSELAGGVVAALLFKVCFSREQPAYKSPRGAFDVASPRTGDRDSAESKANGEVRERGQTRGSLEASS